MKCPRCGTEMEAWTQFCGECGLQMNQAPQQVNYAQQVNQTPQQINYASQQVNYAQQTNPVSQQNYVPRNYASQQNYMPQANRVPQQNKKSNTGLILVIVLLAAVLLIVGIIVVALLIGAFSGKDSKPANSGYVSSYEDENEDEVETGQAPAQVAGPEAENFEHTIMIYMVGSDLETYGGLAAQDIQEIFEADYGENTRIVLQTGGCLDWSIEGMTDGEVERWEIDGDTLQLVETLGKTRMLTAEALADFITFAAEAYPAEKYSLVMWDHGGGVPIGFGQDEIYPNDTLYDYQIGEALEQAGVYFECVAFDACNMCTLEVAMALKDYAKYMVAAESVVVGYGMDYIGWLGCYAEEDVDFSESYEVMAMTYMDSVEEIGRAGSISVIDLRKIQSVYDAYVAYIASVHDDVLNGGYEEYVLARENCGLYEYTESVDIITLATEYPTEASTDLMNAAVNAVCYTESDYAYGHGLAAYNPSEYIYYYGDARYSMEAMGYDTELLAFYDDVVSIGLSYMGTDYVEAYAGNWFNEELAYGHAGEDYEPGEYVLETVQMNGYQAIPLSEEDWGIASDISVSLMGMSEDGSIGLVLGRDNLYSVDENGYIIVEKPQKWTFVNGNIACYVAVDYWEDAETGAWTQIGAIVALCNGEPVMIRVHYDETHPQGIIQGYYPYDFNGREGSFEFKEFMEDDVVEIVLPYYYYTEDGARGDGYYNHSEETYYASELVVEFDNIDLSGDIIYGQYEIMDVYENVYTSEWIELY